MTTADLTNPPVEIITGNDNIVMPNYLEGIGGGRTLDATDYPHPVIHAGHVIIKDSAGEYKPMPINEAGTDYGALPEGASYVGYLIASIPTARPFAGIMVRGTINPKATPFKMDAILAAVKAALPLIDYMED